MRMNIILVLISALVLAQSEKTALRTRTRNLQTATFSCVLIELATEFDDQSSIFEHICQADGLIYSIDDNNGVIAHKLGEGGLDVMKNSGRYQISMTNVFINMDPVVTTTPSTEITIKDLTEKDGRRLSVTGTRTVAIIRVTGSDSGPVRSAANIANAFFGSGGKDVNMARRYELCSMGELKFVPANAAGFVGGVADLTISMSLQGSNAFDVVNKITDTLPSALGSNLRNFDHIVYALPPGTTFRAGGTTGWLAFAYMNSYLSVYNGHNIAFISNEVHEIGHNLGLMHSSHGDVTYGDQSGTMGYGYGEENFPQMCFNAAKSWQLGWYANKSAELSVDYGAFTGYLDAFVDYDNVPSNEHVLLKVGNLHMIYNRAKGINLETQEFVNQVTVTEKLSDTDFSHAVGALGSGNQVTLSGYTIKVCSMENDNGVDKALISVWKSGGSDGCSNAPTPVRGGVAPDPTPPPVVAATRSPTFPRTPSPTPPPVSDPTNSPTPPPTPRPTQGPSPGPTPFSTTPMPTPPPTPGPTPGPTNLPTPPPTPRPTSAPITPAPTHADCEMGEMDVRITIRTDSKPGETRWVLKKYHSSPIDWVVKMDKSFHQYEYRYCLPDTEVYEFRLSDTGGDGIKSADSGEGFYEIKVNGKAYSEGGDFGATEVDYIRGPCGLGQKALQFILKTGNEPEDISYSLTADVDGVIQNPGGGPWPAYAGRNINFVNHECLSTSPCYTFELRSSTGKGMVNGNLEINFGEENVGFTNFKVGSSQIFKFGDGCDGINVDR